MKAAVATWEGGLPYNAIEYSTNHKAERDRMRIVRVVHEAGLAQTIREAPRA